MDSQELSEHLPPARSDEPPSLRQDIVDELADHLQCALRRELFKNEDAANARQRVLDQFGDPREVARKLWLQAMWSKIMTQRLLLVAMGLLVAACLGLTGVLLSQMQQQRVTLAEQQRLLAQTVEQLTRLSEAKANEPPPPPPPPTPSSIKVKLTLDTPDGPPAVGYSVSLMRLGVDNNFGPGVRADSAGIVDFGYFESARYQLQVETPKSRFAYRQTMTLPLSTAHTEPIVCPSEADAETVWSLTLPDDLKKSGLQAVIQWDRSIDCDQHEWHFTGVHQNALVHSDESWEKLNRPYQIQLVSLRDLKQSPQTIQRCGFSIYSSEVRQDHTSTDRDYVGVRVKTVGLVLIRPSEYPNTPMRRSQSSTTQTQSPQVSLSKYFEVVAPRPASDPKPGQFAALPWHPLKVDFVVVADKRNQWTLQLPDELIEQAREYLKADPIPTESDSQNGRAQEDKKN